MNALTVTPVVEQSPAKTSSESVETSMYAKMTELISIIAVQGLGASPYYTWVKKVAKADGGVEEVMWL